MDEIRVDLGKKIGELNLGGRVCASCGSGILDCTTTFGDEVASFLWSVCSFVVPSKSKRLLDASQHTDRTEELVSEKDLCRAGDQVTGKEILSVWHAKGDNYKDAFFNAILPCTGANANVCAKCQLFMTNKRTCDVLSENVEMASYGSMENARATMLLFGSMIRDPSSISQWFGDGPLQNAVESMLKTIVTDGGYPGIFLPDQVAVDHVYLLLRLMVCCMYINICLLYRIIY